MLSRRASRSVVACALALAALAGCDGTGGTLDVTDARVRAVIPGQDRTVGYFTVHNRTGEDVVLTGAGAPAVRAIEMHVTRREDGVARMRRLDEVVIPAGETVRFEPGGRHLMLFGVSAPGPFTDITLKTRAGQELSVRFETMALDDGRTQ